MRKILHITSLIVLAVIMLGGALVLPPGRPAEAQVQCTSINPYSIQSGLTPQITITFSELAGATKVDLNGLQISTIILTDNPLPPPPSPPDSVAFTIPSPGLGAGSYPITVLKADNSALCRITLTVIDFSITPIPAATNTPAPTAFARPLITVVSYGASSQRLFAGQDFDWELNITNSGSIDAHNVVVTFEAGDFVPRVTGGVQSVGFMWPGNSAKLIQPFTATKELSGKSFATLNMKIEYTDVFGTAYTGAFTLTYPAGYPPSSGPVGPTATPTLAPRPQLVITGYKTDPEILQPGTQFTLQMEIRNLGTSPAKGISMIVGGGGSTSSGSGDGTPGAPGGVSGGGGEFTNFAPLGSSNVQYLGDILSTQGLDATQDLIVNVTANPGAYPFKVSFVYLDEKNKPFTDDQVITLLVYQLPQVEVSFYQDPNPIMAGQPNQLPIQIVNLGKKSAVLGSMEVTGPGLITNGTILVGNLDPGGYFTLDAEFIPDQAGPAELTVTVNYTDDFNKPQSITQTIEINVMEMEIIDPGMGEGGMPIEPMPPPEESFFEAVIRFFKGLLGLGSERILPTNVFPGESFPIEGDPSSGGGGGEVRPIPAPAKGP